MLWSQRLDVYIQLLEKHHARRLLSLIKGGALPTRNVMKVHNDCRRISYLQYVAYSYMLKHFNHISQLQYPKEWRISSSPIWLLPTFFSGRHRELWMTLSCILKCFYVPNISLWLQDLWSVLALLHVCKCLLYQVCISALTLTYYARLFTARILKLQCQIIVHTIFEMLGKIKTRQSRALSAA